MSSEKNVKHFDVRLIKAEDAEEGGVATMRL
jgi:hypothetical protein